MKKVVCILSVLFIFQGCGDSAPDKPNPLGWLQVEDGRVVDEAGREIMLRGMNARIEGIFDVSFLFFRVF